MLRELRRLQGRLEPFQQRQLSLLATAATASYSSDEAREEGQRLLALVGESQRLVGNALLALAELRCALGGAPPRHLHVARPPPPHYGPPVLLQQAAIPIQINVGTTVTMTGNGARRWRR